MSLILKSIGILILDILETVVIALSIFVVIYLLAFQPHEVKGQSMDGAAGFHDGQYILTDKISYKLREPRRGEVIVFKYPLNKSKDYIKRIIGIPGDQISIVKNRVYIYPNGQKTPIVLDESDYLSDGVITSGKSYLQDGKKITLGPNEYFVMGDNRTQSSDSRIWGPVSKEDIIGRSFFRYWPPNEIGLVHHGKFSQIEDKTN